MKIINADNLQALHDLHGEKFDLAELDGPYMAGLEDWDNLSEEDYIQHYADRLTALRSLLQPWGVVFVFGYPEGVAEIKSWAHRTKTLYCRRWLTWYKQVTAHKGRKVENILLFTLAENGLVSEFKAYLTKQRKGMQITISQAMALTESRKHLAGKGAGMMWFEAESAKVPSATEYAELKEIFNIPNRFDILLTLGSFEGITDIDFFSKTYHEQTESLNGDGLRSKPVGLYIDLFKPTIPPTETHKALILYGGSGNAAIAAEALGYDVTVIEQDPKRCALIESRQGEVQKWREKLSQVSLFDTLQAVQPELLDS